MPRHKLRVEPDPKRPGQNEIWRGDVVIGDLTKQATRPNGRKYWGFDPLCGFHLSETDLYDLYEIVHGMGERKEA